MAPTLYGGRLIGALVLWRTTDQPPWTAQETQMVDALAGQLAAAIDHHIHYHSLLDASFRDPLTGLLNRRAFDTETLRRFHRAERSNKCAALLYLDLDNFKHVNDCHGHQVGDAVLCHVADVLVNNTRSSDLVARLGGDEFAVWLDDVTEEAAVKRARIFLAAAETLAPYSGSEENPLHLSIGIAIHRQDRKESLEILVSRADAAMYRVKRSGKGDFAVAAEADPP
jgi:diguanylate cyclase (GGDEF)-like protein